MAQQRRGNGRPQDVTGFLQGAVPSAVAEFEHAPDDVLFKLETGEARGLPKDCRVPDKTRLFWRIAPDRWSTILVYPVALKPQEVAEGRIAPLCLHLTEPVAYTGPKVLLKPVRGFPRAGVAPAADALSIIAPQGGEAAPILEDFDASKPVTQFRDAAGQVVPCRHWSDGRWGVYAGLGGAWLVKFAAGAAIQPVGADEDGEG